MKSLFLLLAFAPSIALANFEFSPSLSVYKSDKDTSMSQIELRAGYEFESGLYVGGFYSLASDKFIDGADQWLLGPQIGYNMWGFYSLVGYNFVGEQDLHSGGIKYSNPNGLQASIGYRIEVTQDVFLSPEITWRSIEWRSREVQGIPQGDSGRKDTYVLPGITVLFKF